jgi:hypothetical protein
MFLHEPRENQEDANGWGTSWDLPAEPCVPQQDTQEVSLDVCEIKKTLVLNLVLQTAPWDSWAYDDVC